MLDWHHKLDEKEFENLIRETAFEVEKLEIDFSMEITSTASIKKQDKTYTLCLPSVQWDRN